ncbi:hypothetical protein SOVF_036650 [Spinacia oleracea]|uniref:WW domain-containing protein n=1 Tax=Spinacia oleracea TaxID=3562 RepID=A0A9R0JL71_SPIOL|nr:uncharacterized protein LOC110778129 [Spinacia oleracea]KNA22139.1 hypothetical protein SOVF_036650 [Spinacia oleracea]
MVSFQAPFLRLNDQRNPISETTNNDNNDINNSKNMKRKWDDAEDEAEEEVILPYKHWRNPKAATAVAAFATKSFSDIELHLETPLPSEWQRCLDMQSGEIHFYNTRTQKRTQRDPRERSTDPPSPRECHMSLDLELNLPCGSLNHNNNNNISKSKSTSEKKSLTMMIKNKKPSYSPPPPPVTPNLFRSLSTAGNNTTIDLEAADEEAEMVATACNRCHMLVMLCKTSPTCPNCKYVHPPCQTLLDLFKPRLSLSC